jgi:hypothetical protein
MSYYSDKLEKYKNGSIVIPREEIVNFIIGEDQPALPSKEEVDELVGTISNLEPDRAITDPSSYLHYVQELDDIEKKKNALDELIMYLTYIEFSKNIIYLTWEVAKQIYEENV